MRVRAWNTYSVNGEGKLVIGREDIVSTGIAQAMDLMEKEANAWNKRHKKQPEWQVNFITCNGFIRAI